MEDFIGLIVVFIIYFLAAGSGSKKKKRQRRQKQRPFAQGGQTQQASARRQEKPAFYEQEKPAERKPAAPAAPAQKPCHDTRSIHLHEVSSWQMDMAGEGEDPCHAGGFETVPLEESSPIYASEIQTDRRALAQDVLRGVVMSEILTRPCNRRATQRNGRMR